MRQSQWVILLVPLSYFLRRIAMCLCLVFWIEFFWGQIAVQIMATVFVIILLQWSRPLESNFATNMETFNEVITLLVIYLLMCFSDFVGDPTMRNECGKAFIAIVIFYALVHITLLFKDVIAKLILSCRKCFLRCKKNKISRGIFLTSYFVPARNENVDTAKDSIRRPTE